MPTQNKVDGEWSEDEETELRRLIDKRLKSKRGSKGHDIKFAADLLTGEDGEALLVEALKTGEVKRDFAAGNTGNVFVEHRSWSKPSGIETTDADYWFFVLGCEHFKDEVIIGIKTSRLREIVNRIKWEVRGGDASRGKLVPIKKLIAKLS